MTGDEERVFASTLLGVPMGMLPDIRAFTVDEDVNACVTVSASAITGGAVLVDGDTIVRRAETTNDAPQAIPVVLRRGRHFLGGIAQGDAGSRIEVVVSIPRRQQSRQPDVGRIRAALRALGAAYASQNSDRVSAGNRVLERAMVSTAESFGMSREAFMAWLRTDPGYQMYESAISNAPVPLTAPETEMEMVLESAATAMGSPTPGVMGLAAAAAVVTGYGTSSAPMLRYRYDGRGNITEIQPVVDTSLNSASQDVGVCLEYDALGRLASVARTYGAAYDCAGRVKETATPSKGAGRIKVRRSLADDKNLRVLRTVNEAKGLHETSVYDTGGQLLATIDQTLGTHTNEYYYLDGELLAYAKPPSTSLMFTHNDWTGTP